MSCGEDAGRDAGSQMYGRLDEITCPAFKNAAEIKTRFCRGGIVVMGAALDVIEYVFYTTTKREIKALTVVRRNGKNITRLFRETRR